MKEEGKNPCLKKIENCGGLEVLEKLQLHKSEKVYEKVVAFLMKFNYAEDPL